MWQREEPVTACGLPATFEHSFCLFLNTSFELNATHSKRRWPCLVLMSTCHHPALVQPNHPAYAIFSELEFSLSILLHIYTYVFARCGAERSS